MLDVDAVVDVVVLGVGGSMVLDVNVDHVVDVDVLDFDVDVDVDDGWCC